MSTPSFAPAGRPGLDRPTIVNDPIREVRNLRRFEFVRVRPPISVDGALVLVAADGSTTTYGADRQPTRGELVVKNFRTLYEVDLAHHRQFFEYRLPSRGDAFFFEAQADLSWHVQHPETIVRRGVRDVRAVLESNLRRLMTSKTRLFAIEDNAAAEAEVNRALAEAKLAEEFGLKVSCDVRLSLDAEALEHFAILRRHTYGNTQAEVQHQGVRAASLNEHEIIQLKLDFYNRLLAEDQNLWGMMLIRNPDDVPLVLEGRRADEREAMSTQLRFIQQLLDAGQLEEHMLEEPMRMALEGLRVILSKAADGSTTQRPLYKQQLPSSQADDKLPDADADDDR